MVSMSDPNAPDTSAETCPTGSKVRLYRGPIQMRTFVATKSLTTNKSRDDFFLLNAPVVGHRFNITVSHHRSAFYQNEQRGRSTFSS